MVIVAQSEERQTVNLEVVGIETHLSPKSSTKFVLNNTAVITDYTLRFFSRGYQKSFRVNLEQIRQISLVGQGYIDR